MTRANSNHSGTLGFHSLRRYTVVWFYDLKGIERSYRWKHEEVPTQTQKLLKRGFTLKCDPFARHNVTLKVST